MSRNIIEIKLKKNYESGCLILKVEKGLTIEEIYQKYACESEFRVLAAKMDNKVVELSRIIEHPCNIELLDIRNQAAYLIYQHSLCMIFLKALNDKLGDIDVTIANSLNKGLFVELSTERPLSKEEVGDIDSRMRAMIEEDITIGKLWMKREDVISMFEDFKFTEKVKILQKKQNRTMFKLYKIGDYSNFFYGQMVPSTGYIDKFELRRYRRGLLLRFPRPTSPHRVPKYVDEKNMYTAFGEAKRWQTLLGISYVTDLNGKIENGEAREIIQLSEALHEKKIVEIAEMIKERHKRIILIAGPSSSGKTTFARRLCVQLKVNGLKPIYLGTDDYFLNRDETPLDADGNKNFEDLEAIDTELFNSQMNALLAGEAVDLPEFDFLKGKKIFGLRKMKIDAKQPIVIEGIHALNGQLTSNIADEEKFKIYISPLTQLNIDRHNRVPTTDARMLRRIVRDYKYRGHSAAATIEQWPRVRKGEDKNIFPYSGEADVFFNSQHIYEISVLKKYVVPLLEEITKDRKEFAEAQRLLGFLSFFDVIEDDELIVNNSILREFIGGSVFI